MYTCNNEYTEIWTNAIQRVDSHICDLAVTAHFSFLDASLLNNYIFIVFFFQITHAHCSSSSVCTTSNNLPVTYNR